MTLTAQEAAQASEPLDIARNLAAIGIPVFAAPPAPGTKIGFRLPSRWQQTQPDLARVAEWQPGWALCMTCGCGLDVIDIDTYAGGDLNALNGAVPDVYGKATTPSGGFHLFIASLGVRSKNGLYPGIDIKAGDAQGEGRGFVFIAPTAKPSKVDGTIGSYCWMSV